MADDLNERLKRVYAAIGQTVERDPARFGAEVEVKPSGPVLTFRGGQTDAQLQNSALLAVFHVAHLRDHLKGYFRANGGDPSRVEAVVDSTPALQVVIDLANRDKHGLPRTGGLSKRSPQLLDVTRAVRFTGGVVEPQLAVSFRPGVTPTATGDVSARVTGTVADGTGQFMGDLQTYLSEALAAFEGLLREIQPVDSA